MAMDMFVLALFFAAVFLNEATFSIENRKCAFIYLSIGAKSGNITINWSLNCKRNDDPDKLIFYKYKNIILEIDLRKEKRQGFRDSGIKWNYDVFPGGWYPNNSHPLQEPFICYPYEVKSYKGSNLHDSQCFHVHVQWMTRFKKFADLRIGNMFIPGTHFSGAIGVHQNFDFWGQLVFGMRYFDIVVKKRKQFYIVKGRSLGKELFLLKRFLQLAKREVVILDIRGFDNFKTENDHAQLIHEINGYVGRWLIGRKFSRNKSGPKLGELWRANKRVILNYRKSNMVKNFEFLWNEVFIKDGKKTSMSGLKKYIPKAGADVSYKQMMSSLVGILYPNSSRTDPVSLADKVNPKLREWYNINNVKRHINIFVADFFESTKLHIDCVWINKNHKEIKKDAEGE